MRADDSPPEANDDSPEKITRSPGQRRDIVRNLSLIDGLEAFVPLVKQGFHQLRGG
jgi:hypothetical protein